MEHPGDEYGRITYYKMCIRDSRRDGKLMQAYPSGSHKIGMSTIYYHIYPLNKVSAE